MDLLKSIKGDKNQKKRMSEKEAFDLIDEWGESLEVRLIDEDYEEVKKEIWLAVAKERLTFNHEDERFNYVLKNKIKDRNGNDVISQIKIHETDMEDKRGMTKSKEDIDTLASMFKAYCKRDDMSEIEHGFLTRIKDRDQAIISAVILGFFVQAVPGRKSDR